MSKRRVTIEVLRSGQPRPYADSESITRVTFEWVHMFLGGEMQEDYMDEATVRSRLTRLGLLPDLPTRSERKHGLDGYIDYVKPIDPRVAKDVMPHPYGDPTRTVGHIWEFRIVSPYCD